MDGLEGPFKKVLSKFKFEELPGVLSRVFGDSLPWENVARKLDALRLDRRATTVAEVCFMIYKRTRPAKEEALKTLWLLQLYEVSAHSTRKWFGIKLREPFPDAPPCLENINNIERQLSRTYRKELRNAAVCRIIVGSCHYVMAIEEKTSKKGTKFLPPVFFAYNTDLEQPYAFYTPKLSKTYPLDCFSSAMGYQDYRSIALVGQDVKKLFESARKKNNSVVALRAPVLDIVPVTQEYITDLTGYFSRTKFAMDALPGNSGMKTLTLQSENEWRGTSIIPELKDKDCFVQSSLTLEARNGVSIEDVLRKMIVDGTVKTPLPPWLLKFAQQPRNIIKLSARAPVSNSSIGAFERTGGTENCYRDEDDDFSRNSP